MIILGVGFGALKNLRDANIRITLVDKHDYHAFQPLLYKVAPEELKPRSCGTFGRSVKVKLSDLWTPYFPGSSKFEYYPERRWLISALSLALFSKLKR